MRGKKAQLVEGVILLATIIIVVNAFSSAVRYNEITSKAIEPPSEAVKFYNRLDKEAFLHKEAARLAIYSAYADILKIPADDCEVLPQGKNKIAIWNSGCEPKNSKVSDDFLKLTSEKFKEISGKQKIKIEFERKRLRFDPLETESSVFKISEIVSYNLTHRFLSSFYSEYPDLDLEKIHFKAVERINFCSKEKSKFEECMKELSVGGWKNDVVDDNSNSYLIFTLKSDSYFFYNNNFQPFEVKFAVKKLS